MIYTPKRLNRDKMKNEKEKNKLLKRFEKVCKDLESLDWKEYEQGLAVSGGKTCRILI